MVYNRDMAKEYTTKQAAERLGVSFRSVTQKAWRLGLGRVIAGVRLLKEKDIEVLAQDARKTSSV